MSAALNHVTFYLTHKILERELVRFRAKSSIDINRRTGIVTVGELRTFHKVMKSPSEMRQRMQGIRWHGYSFHDSIRSVNPDLVHWLNQEVAKNANRYGGTN